MASKLPSLYAGAAARREALWKRGAPFSSSTSFSSRPPRPLLLPTDAAALSLAHGPSAPALVDSLTGRVTTFSGLEATARATAAALRSRFDFDDGSKNVDPATGARAAGPRVAVLGRPSPGFAAALWGVWAAGGCAVPLHHELPARAMAASLADVGASAILHPPPPPPGSSGGGGGGGAAPSFEARVRALAELAAETRDANGGLLPGGAPACLPWAALQRGGGGGGGRGGGGDEPRRAPSPPAPSSAPPAPSPPVAAGDREDPSLLGALVLFTSGTTGRPKPALHTHRSLRAQAGSLREAWGLSGGDLVLNCLPWHHVHGLVNALVAPLAAGAAVEVAGGFSAAAAWESLCRGRRGGEFSSSLGEDPPLSLSSSSSSPSSSPHFALPFSRPVSIFMGVPTMYSHLLTALESERRRSGSSGNGDGSRSGDGGRTRSERTARKALPSLEEGARAAAALRLSICGSAACPVPLARRWDELVERGKRKRGAKEEEESASHPPSSATTASLSSSSSSPASPAPSSSLLERYGMTEAGMILGQSLEGPRVRGVVGRPMPGVEVKLRRSTAEEEERGGGGGEEEEEERVDSLEAVRSRSSPLLPAAAGELLVRWPGMFSAYWGREKETREAFLEEEDEGAREGGRWFATGDVALRSAPSPTSPSSSPSSASSPPPLSAGGAAAAASPSSGNDYRLLGRASVDILKVGGEKVSALEVEDALLAHGGVAEAAVVAVDGGDRGDAVAAALVASRPLSLPLPTLAELRAFVAEVLPRAALPSKVVFVDALPRNAMGKVDKRRAREEAFGSGGGGGGGV